MPDPARTPDRPTAYSRAWWRGSIAYHVEQVVSCLRAGCSRCAAHEESSAYLMRVQRDAVARQRARRARENEAERRMAKP